MVAEGNRSLPALTVCPLPGFKTRGKYYNLKTYLNNTFDLDEVFVRSTVESLKNKTGLYRVKEVYTLLLGRCYMVT